MKSILQMATARWRPKIEYVGTSGKSRVYHVKLPGTATEDDIYACKEGIASLGFTVICYTTDHLRGAHLGVFSEC